MTGAGQYDRRVTITRPGDPVDGEYGPQPGAPVVVAARVPARRLDTLPPRTMEATEGMLRQSHKPARLRMRYARGITSDMFVVMHDENDTVYQIMTQPAEIGRREALEFMIAAYTS